MIPKTLINSFFQISANQALKPQITTFLINEKISLKNRFYFSSANKQEDSHPDFQPKVKQTQTPAVKPAQTTTAAPSTGVDAQWQFIDKLVKDNKVVLFMKGTPQMPMCGYSNFVIQVLKFYKIKSYQTIDILKDESMRQKVKQYSNWPTYPQLYINGKLIGGSDIINEMHKEGSFKEIVEKEKLSSV